MDFALIKRASRPISADEWLAVIRSHPALEQVPDRAGVNPFTDEPVVFSGAGKAYLVIDGRRVGNAALEEGEVRTTGISRTICEEVVRSLSAEVFEDDRS